MAKPRVQRHRIAANEPIDVPVGVYCELKSQVWPCTRRVVDSVATQDGPVMSFTCVNLLGITISISTISLNGLSLRFSLFDLYLDNFYLHHFYLYYFYLYDFNFYDLSLSTIPISTL